MKSKLAASALSLALIASAPAQAQAESGIEQPAYQTVLKDGSFELRDYAPQTVAEVTRRGSRRQAQSDAFWPLANYIFAKERAGEKIAMTAPVTATPQSAQGEWVVRFSMPSQYTLDTLPRPAQAEIRLEQVPAMRMASVRFSGVMNDGKIARHQAELMDWITAQGLTPAGLPSYAGYNSPMTPGFMRRNEVLIPVN